MEDRKTDDSMTRELDGLIAQWNQLCEYLEKLDTDHWSVFTIILTALSLFFVINTNTNGINMETVYWAMPVVIMFILYHEAYRLRVVSALKGYLARIEDRIDEIYSGLELDYGVISNKNKKYKYNRIFRWFSQFDIIFMSRNNWANQLFPIPVLITAVLSHGYFIYQKVILDHNYIYLSVILLVIALDCLPFTSIINNEKIQMKIREEKADEVNLVSCSIRKNINKKKIKIWVK